MPTVLVRDETTSGKRVGELTVDILTERVTVRELIRARVYQEVEDFNRRQRAEAGAGGMTNGQLPMANQIPNTREGMTKRGADAGAVGGESGAAQADGQSGDGRSRVFRGLVQPTETEAVLNGFKMKRVREVDWKAQFEKACAAFEGNGFLVLVDERQVEGLDEEVVLGATSTVTFLKLVPLVGG